MTLGRKEVKMKLTCMFESSALMWVKTRVVSMFVTQVMKMSVCRNNCDKFSRFCFVAPNTQVLRNMCFGHAKCASACFYNTWWKHFSPYKLFSSYRRVRQRCVYVVFMHSVPRTGFAALTLCERVVTPGFWEICWIRDCQPGLRRVLSSGISRRAVW
jgi:hypothetical protein